MKNSKLTKLAWVIFALALGNITAFAQQNGSSLTNGNSMKNASCTTIISGLSDQQAAQIQKLEGEHLKAMELFREKRRATFAGEEKAAIREQMLAEKENHRNEVKNLLSAEQQAQYGQLLARGDRHQFQNTGNRGNRNIQAGQQTGKGKGFGQGNKGTQGLKGNNCQGNRNNPAGCQRGRNFN